MVTVKEYYIIKPVLKQDRKYAPLIHTMDSVILKDGIDEVCERVYGEKRWIFSMEEETAYLILVSGFCN